MKEANKKETADDEKKNTRDHFKYSRLFPQPPPNSSSFFWLFLPSFFFLLQSTMARRSQFFSNFSKIKITNADGFSLVFRVIQL